MNPRSGVTYSTQQEFDSAGQKLSGAPGYVEDAGATPGAFFQETTVPSLEIR
jgi:hypothetical protein